MKTIVKAATLLAVLMATAAHAGENQESPYCEVAPAAAVGLQEVSRSKLSERTLDIVLDSVAMHGQQHVAVTLPQNYDASGKTRYPVLYLLHGSIADYKTWFDNNIEGLTGDLPIIVVAVNSGSGNGYIDWYGTLIGSGETAPAWQTHHLEEVLPWVDRTFPVRTDRNGRAIAGISMGGGGTMHYAALRPDLFGAAASFSGAVNVTREYPYFPALNNAVDATQLASGPNPYCAYGDFILEHVTWKAADATYLAENLKNTGLWISCGSGPPHAVPLVNLALDPVELEACEQTEEFMLALDANGIPHTDSFYIGAHSWTYWSREIAKMLPWLMQQYARADVAPQSFDYRSAHADYSVWGWDFHAQRNVREFAYLRGVSASGLTAIGSGRLEAITPPLYKPGASYQLSGGTQTQSLTADDSGRLAFSIDLGPEHDHQQMAFRQDTIDGWQHTAIAITQVPEVTGKSAATGRYGGSFAPGVLLLLALLRRRALLLSPLLLTACNLSLPGSIDKQGAAGGAALEGSVPLKVDSTYGSGNLGQWQVDEFGLPYFRYDLDQVNDPRGKASELLLDATQAQHQIGNDHITGFGWNDGHTILWSQARQAQWANEWEPNYNEWSGGYGYVHTARRSFSTFWLDRPEDAQTERDFGLGYYRRVMKVENLSIREETYAPWGDDPLLLHDVTITNTGSEAQELSWFEYWDVNPYNRAMLHRRGLAAPQYDENLKTLSVKQLPDADLKPLTIFSAALDAPVEGYDSFSTAFFGVVPNRAMPTAVAADKIGHSIAPPAALAAPNTTMMALRAPLKLAPGETRRLRYAYGMAHEEIIPALVEKYRAQPESFAQSERAWADWVPHADLGEQNKHIAREIAWTSYLLRSAAVYEEECGAHTITQGGYYQYSLGYNLGYRSWLHYLYPMVYSEPEMAREILRYSIKLQPELGNGFVPYGTGPLCIRFDLGTSNDLDFWLLLAAADYGLGTRDLKFFDEALPYYDSKRPDSAWEHIKLSFRHQESMKGLNGGYTMGATGDWSDFATPTGPMTESMLVAAQLAYAYPKLAELADLRGDAAFAMELRVRANELLDTLDKEWTGLGWYSRGYFGVQQIGKGVPYGEPQPWAILAGAPDAAQANVLVGNIRRFLTGIGAPDGPSMIGSGMAPSRKDPDISERGPALPLSGALPDFLGIALDNVPNAPLAGAAVYPGGAWFDVNGWLVWALSTLDGAVPNANEYAWDEYVRNAMSTHATVYPDHWASTISVDDVCNVWYSSGPERCGIGVPTFSGSIAEQPIWMMMNSLRLAGLSAHDYGFRIAPHYPFNDFALTWPKVGIARKGKLIQGYFRLEADGPVQLRVKLPDGVTAAQASIAGAAVPVEIAEGEARFTLPGAAGGTVEWSVTW